MPITSSVESRGGRLVAALLLLLGWAGCQAPVAESAGTEAGGMTEAETDAMVVTAGTDAEVAAARAEGREANQQLELDRQAVQLAAWRHVKAIAGMWSELPPEFFPGLTTLEAGVAELRKQIEVDDRILVGLIEPERLTTRNPAFWRAVMETNPEDPVVELFEQMLWAARGDFDRSIWLIEMTRFGPALPDNVHKLVYSLADEMRRLRARQNLRRNQLLENVPAEGIGQVVATTRSFQPEDPDWALMSIVVRLQMAGINMDDLAGSADAMDRMMARMRGDWELVARSNPMVGARLAPERSRREAAEALAQELDALSESRGAFGGRDVVRLGDALAEAGFYGEALLAKQRATALRGFTVPSDSEVWWKWLPEIIGEEETLKLEEAAMMGLIRPVTFFHTKAAPEGVSLLPLHPILTDRNLRRLQEVQRRLEMPELTDAGKTGALITLAETFGHLGRWDEAVAALAEIPEEYATAGAPMRVWISLWSGRVDGIDDEVAAVDPSTLVGSPALPALVKAARGHWGAGADIFLESARSEDVATEFRAYYTLMASAFERLAGADDAADALIEEARGLSEEHDWVGVLVRGMAGESKTEPVGDNITEIAEAGRVCEQRFYRAFQREISPTRRRALLEGCVSTGVVDFVEYTASLLRLRQLDAERWDPTLAPPPEPVEAETDIEDDDWTRGAAPSWSIPS